MLESDPEGTTDMADEVPGEDEPQDAVEAERAKLKDAIKSRDNAKGKLRDLEAELEALREKAGKYDQLTEEQKTEQQRLIDRAEAAEKRASDLEAQVTAAQVEVLRSKIAAAKGLDPVLADRLQGETEDELEADAELLAGFQSGSGRPPSERPATRLTGGGDPELEPEETDPVKLAAKVPRR